MAVQTLKNALEEILKLTDDQNYSHAARMLKIKGLTLDSLALMERAQAEKPKAMPIAYGSKDRVNIQKSYPAGPRKVTV